ncbi:hypothetical protein FSP39_025448 [Pinctada imbricata]|uniref:J domain-containing protein n=1 Tax=Pinctada imbricata TaxID=66713 RepID=A0AA88Y826_PINIB|nr:hypothetical protein FSP39_025448 [Pinctada imbricata]
MSTSSLIVIKSTMRKNKHKSCPEDSQQPLKSHKTLTKEFIMALHCIYEGVNRVKGRKGGERRVREKVGGRERGKRGGRWKRGIEGASSEVEQHLELGKKLLAAGQLADALQHYHAAVDGDPSNYLTYFRRATVYLALGKSKSALPDLQKVIELKPDFTAARMQRANVLMKQGRLTEAEKDYIEILQKNPLHEEAQSHLHTIAQVREDMKIAYQLHQHGQFQQAIDLLGRLIEVSPWDPELHETRAECYESIGEYAKAITEIRPTTSLRNDNRKAYFKMSILHYDLGEADESLIQIRECLKLDPDDKNCYPHYKKVKKLVKLLQSAQEAKNEKRWEDCLNKATQILKTEMKVDFYKMKANSYQCHCHSQAGNTKDAFQMCNYILDRSPEDMDALMDRAETYLGNDQFDEAIKDYQKAVNIDGDNRRAQEGLNKAQKLLKQSKKRDYYKILGVKRTATTKQIKSAYKKLAAKWHPDKYKGEEKSLAEKKFIDIAAAKEVLTDKEKRAKFDSGEDPLDPEQQQGGGGPFWHQGFNPFGGGGGGGFQFKFHF